MRSETVSRELYPYAELSDASKEKAREWLRLCQQHDSRWSESVIDDFVTTVAPCFGFTVGKSRGTRTLPAVYWSGFWSQGDGASFAGTWNWLQVSPQKLADNCPADEELAGAMRRLVSLFEGDAGESLTDVPHAEVSPSGSYSHKFCTRFDCENMTDSQQSEFEDISRDLMQWLYRALENEYEYVNSDEQLVESILANEYEFTAEGKIA